MLKCECLGVDTGCKPPALPLTLQRNWKSFRDTKRPDSSLALFVLLPELSGIVSDMRR